MVPGTETVLSQPDLLASLAKRDVVLLGEIHIRAEHHRWQLHVVTGLQALRPDLVIGFEMFPRRVQPALDRWVAGELDVAAFLAAGDWVNVWGYDAALYMPLFHFARMHRIPMVALNLDRDVVRSLSRDGWDSVDAVKDLGLSPPATAKTDYVDRLRAIFEEHLSRGTEAADAASREEGFQRFVATQQAWDRVMAQGLAAPRSGAARPLVVGVIGGGHMEYGAGIPNQLRDLGIGDTAVLLAWDAERPCESLVSAEGEPIADAVFGVRSPAPPPRPTRPLLGVLIETADSGVRVSRVVADSVAEAAGLKAGDRGRGSGWTAARRGRRPHRHRPAAGAGNLAAPAGAP